MQNKTNKPNVLQTAMYCICIIAIVLFALVSCLNTPVVAFDGNKKCQWVETEQGRDPTACNKLPNKYNKITIATR